MVSGQPSEGRHASRRLTLFRGSLRRRRFWTITILLSPALVVLTALFLVPLGLLVWMSLTNWPLFGRISFIGLNNYQEAFGDTEFWTSVVFTVKYTVLVTPVQVFFGYLLAILVRRASRGVVVFRSIYFMPVVIGFAAAAYVFLSLIEPGSGFLDYLCNLVGLKQPDTPILADGSLALVMAVLLSAWKSVGFAMILFMTGMHAVPGEIYDAAEVDGASWLPREWLITIPLLQQTFALVLVLTVAGAMLSFDQFWILTRGGPEGSTTTAVLWIYTVSFARFRLGYGAALSIILLAIVAGITASQVRALRQGGEP